MSSYFIWPSVSKSIVVSAIPVRFMYICSVMSTDDGYVWANIVMISCFVIQNQRVALHDAVMWGYTDTVALLVDHGANVNMKDKVS